MVWPASGLAGLRIVRAEAVEFLLAVERWLKATALLREDVEQDGALFFFEELEGLDEQRQVVSVDRAEVLQAELFEKNRGPQHALGSFFSAAHDGHRGLAAEFLNQARGGFVEVAIALVGDDAVEVTRDGADVAIDGPLVVVEHDDQPLGLFGDVVERFERDAVGKGGVAGDGDHVLFAAGQIARHGHAQSGGEGGAGVARAVAVVLALGAQHEAVEAARLPDGFKALAAAGKDLVDVGLVADVEDELVGRRVKDHVEGQREFDDAEIGPEVAAGLGKSLDQEDANLFGQFIQLRIVELLQVGRRVNGIQQCSHVVLPPGRCRALQKVPDTNPELRLLWSSKKLQSAAARRSLWPREDRCKHSPKYSNRRVCARSKE